MFGTPPKRSAVVSVSTVTSSPSKYQGTWVLVEGFLVEGREAHYLCPTSKLSSSPQMITLFTFAEPDVRDSLDQLRGRHVRVFGRYEMYEPIPDAATSMGGVLRHIRYARILQ
jgi:hypothetical protein